MSGQVGGCPVLLKGTAIKGQQTEQNDYLVLQYKWLWAHQIDIIRFLNTAFM